MIFADSHVHIYSSQFQSDRDAVIAEARLAGVHHLFLPNVDATTIDGMLEAELKHPETCHVMMGLHPCHVVKHFEKDLYLVEDWLAKRPFVGVGEIGLDYYWDKTLIAEQKEALNIQVNLSAKYNLPMSLHCRESMDDVLELLEAAQADHSGKLRGVFHCFVGDARQAERALALGFYLGIGGVVTYKTSTLPQVLPTVPLERILIETDAPYLAPVPHRGKRNSPAYVPLVGQKLAEVYGRPVAEVAEVTTANTLALFGAATPQWPA